MLSCIVSVSLDTQLFICIICFSCVVFTFFDFDFCLSVFLHVQELVVALSHLVEQYESNFCTVALQFIEEEKNYSVASPANSTGILSFQPFTSFVFHFFNLPVTHFINYLISLLCIYDNLILNIICRITFSIVWFIVHLPIQHCP